MGSYLPIVSQPRRYACRKRLLSLLYSSSTFSRKLWSYFSTWKILYSFSAIPRQSKPEPRLADVAGVLIVIML